MNLRKLKKSNESLLFYPYLGGTSKLGSIRRLGLRFQRHLLQQICGFFADQNRRIKESRGVKRRSQTSQTKSHQANRSNPTLLN